MCDTFNYLGTTLPASKAMKESGSDRIKKARKTLYSFRKMARRHGIRNVGLLIKLFTTMVQPTMAYGCEIWAATHVGNSKGHPPSEMLLLQFLRGCLGVRQSTPGLLILAEMGVYPMRHYHAQQVIRYWNRMIKGTGNHLLQAAFQENWTHGEWAKGVRALVEGAMLGLTLGTPQWLGEQKVLDALQTQYLEQFRNPDAKSKTKFYVQHMRGGEITKSKYEMPAYLIRLNTWRQVSAMAKFRMSAHHLEVEKGRWADINRDLRVCKSLLPKDATRVKWTKKATSSSSARILPWCSAESASSRYSSVLKVTLGPS